MRVRVFQAAHELARLGGKACPWSVQWRENGRRRTKTIGSKADADDFAILKEAEILDRVKGINTRKRWQDFEEEYLRDEVEASGKRPRTVKQVRLMLKRFREKIQPTWVYLVDSKTLDMYRQIRLKDKGHHGGPISPHTVRKELRHIHAALAVARRWSYLRDVPDMPKIAFDEPEKVHVTEEHFLALLDACSIAKKPAPALHSCFPEGATPEAWWQALLVTCWVTGARIDSILRFRWENVDFDTGRVLARAADLKQRKDSRPEIAAALPYLEKIAGSDPRLFPWNHDNRTLYLEFYRIQKEAGIHLPCAKAAQEGHVCNTTCHTYGFHAFRYAHARLNYQNPGLQNQMGHATATTTEHYKRWAGRQLAEYGAYVPKRLAGEVTAEQQQNDNKDSNKPRLRIFTA
jgi:integrase